MRASSVRTADKVVRSGNQPSRNDPIGTHPSRGVRELVIVGEAPSEPSDVAKVPAHRFYRLVAYLNQSFRVVDDPLQWMLQQRKGNPRKKNSSWRGRSFCRTRDALVRCVRECCGEIAAEAVSKLQTLPDWHPDWDRKTHFQNLDVRRTDL